MIPFQVTQVTILVSCRERQSQSRTPPFHPSFVGREWALVGTDIRHKTSTREDPFPKFSRLGTNLLFGTSNQDPHANEAAAKKSDKFKSRRTVRIKCFPEDFFTVTELAPICVLEKSLREKIPHISFAAKLLVVPVWIRGKWNVWIEIRNSCIVNDANTTSWFII